MTGAMIGLALLPTADAADYIDRARLVPLAQSVLRVEASGDGRLRVGTGITVAPGIVVTNCHVVGGADQVRVLKRAGAWQVRSIHVDAEHDLCYLRAPSWPGRPITLADETSVRLHQRVAALGYTGGAELSISDGEVLDLHRHDAARVIRTDAGFSSGASGGALVDDGGRLVGILTFRLPGRGDRFYALPVDWIRRFIDHGIPTVEQDPAAASVTSPVRAFWQRRPSELPYFMRADALELERRWAELADLADDWLLIDPGSVEPWIAKAKARREAGQAEAALRAFRRAVRLSAEHVDAWFELGATSLQVAGSRDADEALARLRELDPLLAVRLDAMIQQNRNGTR